MQSKLGLDFKKVEQAKGLAKNIADEVQSFVESYTTVAVERTLCRLLGIDGVDENQVPLPNVVVDDLKSKGVLNQGVLFYIANAMAATGMRPQQIAEGVAGGTIDLTRIEVTDQKSLQEALEPVIRESIAKIREKRSRREKYLEANGDNPKPYLYVIVATGNIYEDVVQAEAAARQGSAELSPPRRISGSCVPLWIRWERSWEDISGFVIIVPAFVCRK